MPKLALYNMEGSEVGKIDLADAVFAQEVNKVAIHQVVVNYLANQRQGTQSTKTRSEVRGGGIKPWRQKGTGRARQGSIRATQWIKGGIALGPKPRDYYYTINKKERQLALKSALSDKVLNESLIVLDSLTLGGYKTKTVVDCLKALEVGKKTLMILASNDAFAVKSAANIPGVKTAQVNTINTYDIVNADTLVIVKDAVAKLEEVYA